MDSSEDQHELVIKQPGETWNSQFEITKFSNCCQLRYFFLNFLLLDRNSIKFIFSRSQKRRAMHGIVVRRKPESVLQRLNIGPRQCFKWLTGIICLLAGDSLMSKMLLFIHLLSHSTASHLVWNKLVHML